MERILISWLGSHDLEAVEGTQPGPVLAAIDHAAANGRPFTAAYFLYNYPEKAVAPYREWLTGRLSAETAITYKAVTLSSPSAYAEIYPAAEKALLETEQLFPGYQRTIHLSPGTPAMTAVWILLVKTRFPSKCIDSWFNRQTGEQFVNDVELPFEIDARFTREAHGRADARLALLHQSEGERLDGVAHVSNESELSEALVKAKKMAVREVPILLLGETGTGKEVMARAIHQASPRHSGPFVAVNCGALPQELAESLLYGHKKGAFTGAHRDHAGYFAQVNGGTLFLDEVGELSLNLQVKLLRVLQERAFTPLGGTHELKSDFRIIAATHRDLMRRVAEGQFREDLFYRLAVGVIKLPPLRERAHDLASLVESLLAEINDELADQSAYQRKQVTPEVIKEIASHNWPGNIRELRATLLRAAVWSEGPLLTGDAVREAMLMLPSGTTAPLTEECSGVSLQDVLDEVAKRHILSALKQTRGNKTRAAKLLGLKSHQVLTGKLEKLGLTGGVTEEG